LQPRGTLTLVVLAAALAASRLLHLGSLLPQPALPGADSWPVLSISAFLPADFGEKPAEPAGPPAVRPRRYPPPPAVAAAAAWAVPHCQHASAQQQHQLPQQQPAVINEPAQAWQPRCPCPRTQPASSG
jgi:hypothetical protein